MDKLELIGKKIEEVRAILEEKKLDYRTVRKDDDNYIVTCDFKPERFNLELDNGIVTAVSFG